MCDFYNLNLTEKKCVSCLLLHKLINSIINAFDVLIIYRKYEYKKRWHPTWDSVILNRCHPTWDSVISTNKKTILYLLLTIFYVLLKFDNLV